MAVNYSKNIVTENLVLCLDAGDIKSYPRTGTTWTDRSEIKRHGTFVASPTFSNNNGGTINFDGSDYIGLGTADTYNYSNISVSVWFKGVTNTSGEVGFPRHVTNIIGKGNWNDSANSWRLGFRSSGSNPATFFGFSYGISFANAAEISMSNLNLLQWNHATGIATPTQHFFYLNGSRVNSKTVTKSTTLTSTFEMQICQASYLNVYFRGSVPIVQIYNKALTDDEVLQNFNAQRGRFGI